MTTRSPRKSALRVELDAGALQRRQRLAAAPRHDAAARPQRRGLAQEVEAGVARCSGLGRRSGNRRGSRRRDRRSTCPHSTIIDAAASPKFDRARSCTGAETAQALALQARARGTGSPAPVRSPAGVIAGDAPRPARRAPSAPGAPRRSRAPCRSRGRHSGRARYVRQSPRNSGSEQSCPGAVRDDDARGAVVEVVAAPGAAASASSVDVASGEAGTAEQLDLAAPPVAVGAASDRRRCRPRAPS